MLRTLRKLPDLGVDFIDTADSYGPNVSEELIREALHPYDGIVVATKAGLARTGPDQWTPLGRPEYLIQQAHASCRRLGVERIDLWQLHRIDPQVPRAEQFDAVKSLLDSGVIRYAGLSEVSVQEIEAASRVFKVSTVQNRYNLVDRGSEDVLDHCAKHGIGFHFPWFPLAAGRLLAADSPLTKIAKAHGAAPSQVALAWTLKRSPVMIPIPGTSKVAHLKRMSARQTSSSRMPSSRPWIAKGGRKVVTDLQEFLLEDLSWLKNVRCWRVDVSGACRNWCAISRASSRRASVTRAAT